MEPKDYTVLKIDGDYAILQPADSPDDTTLVARALLPLDIDEGSRLRWECFTYTLLQEGEY